MTVVRVGEDHFFEALRLSEYAFQYKVPDEKVEEKIEWMKKHHQLYGIIDNNELIAKLHFLPFEVILGQEKWKMGGIAGVATYPEYRRRGFVKEMLTSILQTMKKEGYSVSMLAPFSIPFYRKYGWETLTNRVKCTINKIDLVMKESTQGTIQRYKKDVHFQAISNIYEQYTKRFAGMLVRENEWWEKNVLQDLVGAIYYNVNHQPSGYILYTVKESKMVVEEFVALTSEARKGLWNYICQHDSMINTLELTTYENDPLFYTLHNPNVKLEVSPYFMVRIVDVESFLKQFAFNHEKNSKELILRVTDQYAPWNEKAFLLKNGSITVIEHRDYDKFLKLSINSLSTMMFGYKRPVELYEIGHIEGEENDLLLLEELIPHQQPFFYDFF